MQCPACSNPLTAIHVGALKVDVCQGGCGGIWFDVFELQRVDEENEAAGERLLHIRRGAHMRVDTAHKRDCPRCPGIKLRRHLFNPKSRVEVDECPACGGYWLDHGELAAIRDEQSRTAHAEEVAAASVSAELIRYVYQVRTGHKDRKRL